MSNRRETGFGLGLLKDIFRKTPPTREDKKRFIMKKLRCEEHPLRLNALSIRANMSLDQTAGLIHELTYDGDVRSEIFFWIEKPQIKTKQNPYITVGLILIILALTVVGITNIEKAPWIIGITFFVSGLYIGHKQGKKRKP